MKYDTFGPRRQEVNNGQAVSALEYGWEKPIAAWIEPSSRGTQ